MIQLQTSPARKSRTNDRTVARSRSGKETDNMGWTFQGWAVY